MDCKRDTETISAYLDGELDTVARAELESHLETCDSCRVKLAATRRLGEMFAALPEVTPSSDFEARFWARIARERDEPAGLLSLVFEYFTQRRVIALGAALVGAAVFALLLPQGEPSLTPTGVPTASTKTKLDPDVRIVTNATDFQLLQDPDIDTIADVDALEAWDDDSPG
jgi:anti-sigma factor RsiW